jgi:hypothetical protein
MLLSGMTSPPEDMTEINPKTADSDARVRT